MQCDDITLGGGCSLTTSLGGAVSQHYFGEGAVLRYHFGGGCSLTTSFVLGGCSLVTSFWGWVQSHNII